MFCASRNRGSADLASKLKQFDLSSELSGYGRSKVVKRRFKSGQTPSVPIGWKTEWPVWSEFLEKRTFRGKPRCNHLSDVISKDERRLTKDALAENQSRCRYPKYGVGTL